MPTYAYACKDCDHEFDIVQSFSDDSLTDCPECEGALRKKFNSVGVVFKGSGFYRNDSRSDGSGSKGGASTAASSNGSEGSKDSNGSKGSDSTNGSSTGSTGSAGAGGSSTGDKKSGAAAPASSGSAAAKTPATASA